MYCTLQESPQECLNCTIQVDKYITKVGTYVVIINHLMPKKVNYIRTTILGSLVDFPLQAAVHTS